MGETSIFALDPQVLTKKLNYRDNSSKTSYFLGQNFTDFGSMDWARFIPYERRNETLVMLDDHTSWLTRVKQMLKHGFIHAWFDDNTNFKGAIAGEYTLNQVCAELPKSVKKIIYKENGYNAFSWQTISIKDHVNNFNFLN